MGYFLGVDEEEPNTASSGHPLKIMAEYIKKDFLETVFEYANAPDANAKNLIAAKLLGLNENYRNLFSEDICIKLRIEDILK